MTLADANLTYIWSAAFFNIIVLWTPCLFSNILVISVIEFPYILYLNEGRSNSSNTYPFEIKPVPVVSETHAAVGLDNLLMDKVGVPKYCTAPNGFDEPSPLSIHIGLASKKSPRQT